MINDMSDDAKTGSGNDLMNATISEYDGESHIWYRFGYCWSRWNYSKTH